MKAGTKKTRVREDAKKPLTFVITPEHIKTATCGSAGNCVVAQALKDCDIGQFLEGMEVGSNVTKIYTNNKVVVYTTPHALKRAIPVFDRTGEWNLPVGEYTLLPHQPRPRRWEKAKRHGGVQSMFRGRAVPSRRVMRIEALCAV
jgi:hypothetical protein